MESSAVDGRNHRLGAGSLLRGMGITIEPVAIGDRMGLHLLLAFQAHALEQIRSEEHTSELQSLMRSSYAVFCLKKKKNNYTNTNNKSNKYKNRERRVYTTVKQR